MPEERIIDTLHVGEYPVYEIIEVSRGGDIKIRCIHNPEESITLIRSSIPKLVTILDRIRV
ncbi:MAG: hypothetical protein QHH14_10785 [Clostridiales bacterium]|nr:hypothetical protein [Clostridiales bacterium]